jgi:hypothetical protein
MKPSRCHRSVIFRSAEIVVAFCLLAGPLGRPCSEVRHAFAWLDRTSVGLECSRNTLRGVSAAAILLPSASQMLKMTIDRGWMPGAGVAGPSALFLKEEPFGSGGGGTDDL